MEYIEKKGNVERVYEVLYDKEKLKELLDKIVRTASYREEGTHIILAGPNYENNKFEEGQEPKLLNGDPQFENITSLSEWSSDGIYSYHGDSIQIKGTKVVAPRLGYIIYHILNDDNGFINELMNYQNYSELVDIEIRIDEANQRVTDIDNFSFDKKICAINELKNLVEDKKAGRYFDVKLLQALYDEAFTIIELKLKQETTTVTEGTKIALKDLKEKNHI